METSLKKRYLFDFDSLVDIKIGCVRYILNSKKLNTSYIKPYMLEPTLTLLKQLSVGSVERNPVKWILKNEYSDSADDIYKELLMDHYDSVLNNALSTDIFKLVRYTKKAKDFGALYVASETGSYNDDKWTYNPKNQTNEAFDEVLSVFAPLAQVAKEAKSCMSLEGAWGHCMYSPEQMAKLIKEIDTGYVRTTVDIYNYLYIDNYEERYNIFHKCLDLFGDKIVIFHIKDFVPEGDHLTEVALGKGIMGWDKIIPEIRSNLPNSLLVFEGVKDLIPSLEYFKTLL